MGLQKLLLNFYRSNAAFCCISIKWPILLVNLFMDGFRSSRLARICCWKTLLIVRFALTVHVTIVPAKVPPSSTAHCFYRCGVVRSRGRALRLNPCNTTHAAPPTLNTPTLSKPRTHGWPVPSACAQAAHPQDSPQSWGLTMCPFSDTYTPSRNLRMSLLRTWHW